jgi:uncharacterized membrane protein YoaK (UPF0700 family)
MPTLETSIQTNALPDALLLATTGGLLDVVVFLNHGQVFANAMTGNVIFLGIAVLGKNWKDVIPHLVPIGGFICGVATSKHVRSRLPELSVLLLGLSFEMMALFVLGWLPSSFPHTAFTAIIAFVSAFQVASYRRVERFTYNSTFVTGNLRDMVEGLYDATLPGATAEIREKGHAQALYLGLICLCFFVGAVIGAWAAPRLANYSLWLVEPLLITAALRALLRRTRQTSA